MGNPSKPLTHRQGLDRLCVIWRISLGSSIRVGHVPGWWPLGFGAGGFHGENNPDRMPKGRGHKLTNQEAAAGTQSEW